MEGKGVSGGGREGVRGVRGVRGSGREGERDGRLQHPTLRLRGMSSRSVNPCMWGLTDNPRHVM